VRRLVSILAGLGLIATLGVGVVSAGGPPSLAFYADGVRYRTLGTPTDFSVTGAPDGSFEPIYALGSGLINVAAAAPGDPGFRGGRWMVLPVTWHTTPVQLTSGDQVLAYAWSGLITVSGTPVREFECPVIPVPGNA